MFRRACCLSGLSDDAVDEDPLSAGLLAMRLSFAKSKLLLTIPLWSRDRIGLYREIWTIPNVARSCSAALLSRKVSGSGDPRLRQPPGAAARHSLAGKAILKAAMVTSEGRLLLDRIRL